MTNYGKVHANYDRVVDALREHAEEVFDEIATLIVRLGSLREWSMEDNFTTTESIAELAKKVGLPSVGSFNDEAGLFYSAAGAALGYDTDWPKEADDQPPAKRRCAYTQAEIRDKETGLNTVALIDEGEPGYWPTTYVGDLEYCEGVAKSINEAYGLSEEDVRAIVASSFAASVRSAEEGS